MAKDSSKISNAVYEINAAAKTMKVQPIVIHIAKYATGSNEREVIYKWITENLNTTYYVAIATQ